MLSLADSIKSTLEYSITSISSTFSAQKATRSRKLSIKKPYSVFSRRKTAPLYVGRAQSGAVQFTDWRTYSFIYIFVGIKCKGTG